MWEKSIFDTYSFDLISPAKKLSSEYRLRGNRP